MGCLLLVPPRCSFPVLRLWRPVLVLRKPVMSVDDGPGQAANAAEETLRHGGAVGVGPVPASYTQLDRGHDRCLTLCIKGAKRRQRRFCPGCGGRVDIRDIDGTELEPALSRFAWLAGEFLGGWAHAWRQATVGMVRDGAGSDVGGRGVRGVPDVSGVGAGGPDSDGHRDSDRRAVT